MLNLHFEVPWNIRKITEISAWIFWSFPPICGWDWRLSAERMEVHLHLFSAAEHPDSGVKPSGRDNYFPPADNLAVAGEEHLDEHRGATVSQHFHSWRENRVSQHFHCYRAETGCLTVLLHASSKTLNTSGHMMRTRKHLANICFFEHWGYSLFFYI